MNALSLTRLSMLLAAFLGAIYTLCVLYGLAVPENYRMYSVWEGLLPGFQWLSWGSFFIGLGEALAYGVFFAALYWLLRRLVLLDQIFEETVTSLRGAFRIGGK